MPTPIRVLLETLSDDRLRRLIEHRGLETSRSKADKAETLARSYRGDYGQLVSDVALEDLKVFADRGPEAARLAFDLVGFSRASRSQLEKAIVKVFGEDWAPATQGSVVPWTGGIYAAIVDEDDDDEQEDEGEDEDDDEYDDDGVEDDEPKPSNVAFADVGAEWSRPQLLRRVVQKVLGVKVSRLRMPRFQELLLELQSLGLEASTPSGVILGLGYPSPGIEAKVRLRRVSVLLIDPPPPVVIVGGPSRPWTVTPLPPYEAALRRLKLLTAIPDDARASDAGLLAELVDAASTGLKLSPSERILLEKVAHGLAKGTHSPLAAAHDLSMHTEEPTWTWLLEEMVRLNPHHEAVALHTVAAIRANVRGVPQEAGGGMAVGSASPTIPTPLERPAHTPSKEGTAAVAASAPANVRSLGDLDDMFK